jgi:hypothetical protein
MDLLKIISELETERETLDQTIYALRQLAAGTVKRRGRPPAWLSRIHQVAGGESNVEAVDGGAVPERRTRSRNRPGRPRKSPAT